MTRKQLNGNISNLWAFPITGAIAPRIPFRFYEMCYQLYHGTLNNRLPTFGQFVCLFF